MALYTKSQFAKHCGKKNAHVSMAITRGRLVLSGDYIDSEIPENKAVMEKWRVAAGMDASDTTTPATKESSPQAPEISAPAKSTPPAPKVSAPSAVSSNLSSLEREKKRAEIDWKLEKTQETALKNAKLRGELIPTTMVLDVVGMLGHSFQTQYEIGATNLIMELGHKMKLTPEIEGEIKEKLVVLINKAHKKAIDEAKTGIKNVISAVSSAEIEVTEDEADETDENQQ